MGHGNHFGGYPVVDIPRMCLFYASFIGVPTVWVTDRPTNHATRSVTIGRIYVHRTVMRPDNANGLIFLVLITVFTVHNFLRVCYYTYLTSRFLEILYKNLLTPLEVIHDLSNEMEKTD